MFKNFVRMTVHYRNVLIIFLFPNHHFLHVFTDTECLRILAVIVYQSKHSWDADLRTEGSTFYFVKKMSSNVCRYCDGKNIFPPVSLP